MIKTKNCFIKCNESLPWQKYDHIKLFEDRDIKSSDYPYNAKSDELEEKPESESETESKFEEGMAEKTNWDWQKSNQENNKAQGLKILTPDQMLFQFFLKYESIASNPSLQI